MADLAALLAPGAMVEQLPARVPIANVIKASSAPPPAGTRMRAARSAKCDTSGPAKVPQTAAAAPPLPAEVEASGTGDETTSQQLDEVTLAAAHSARFYRSWMLENLMAGFGAALDQAAGMVGKKSDDAAEAESDNAAPSIRARRVPPNEAADDYRAKVLQLTNATINGNLDYVRKLATARSPAEFVELSADQACAQVKLCVKHVVALARLSRSFAVTG